MSISWIEKGIEQLRLWSPRRMDREKVDFSS